MSLLDVLRSGVAVADGILKPFQSTVSFERYTGMSAGVKQYATAVGLLAIVDTRQRMIRSQTGEVIVSSCTVIFLNITALLAATSNVGLQNEDRITITNQAFTPTLSVGGFQDPGTNVPVATEAYLG